MNAASADQLLPRSTPESQGVASSAVHGFLEAVEAGGFALHSLMLLRHGNVLAEGWWEPYRADLPHILFSLSKSFAATGAGLAIAEGRLSLDDSVLSFFPEEAPAEPSDNLRAMRVRHLLSMATGNDADTTGSLSRLGGDNWARGFLACPVEHAPGTHFVYNSGATYMVSAIVQKVTGERLLDYLTPRLLEPLGIEGATWDTCPRGIDIGGWGLKVRTEDIARFGQLYLQRGMWNGSRLLTEEWVEQATGFQVANGDNLESDWNQGYGFQFWRCRHWAYRGDGAFGQYCVVLPEQDAVVAITSGLKDMQAVLNLVWAHLLPAFGPAPLPADPGALEVPQARLANLKVATPRGETANACAEENLRPDLPARSGGSRGGVPHPADGAWLRRHPVRSRGRSAVHHAAQRAGRAYHSVRPERRVALNGYPVLEGRAGDDGRVRRLDGAAGIHLPALLRGDAVQPR